MRAAAPWITYRPTPLSLYGLLAPESSRKQLLRGLCAAREPEVQMLDRHWRVRGSFARRFIGYFPGLPRIALCLRRISPYCVQRSMALFAARLEQHGRSFRWRLGDHLELMRWKVARDAVGLLESNLSERLKRCPGSGDCGWVFIDTSKNSSRRWCSMAGCGNRAKARRRTRRTDTN